MELKLERMFQSYSAAPVVRHRATTVAEAPHASLSYPSSALALSTSQCARCDFSSTEM